MVDLDRMGPSGAALEIAASDGERAALAKRFGFLGLLAFSARVTVDRKVGGQVVVEGRLRGKVVQACILTLDPVAQDLDETFRIVFKRDFEDEKDPESGDAVINSQADAPEPLQGNMLDVGEIVAEQLERNVGAYAGNHFVQTLFDRLRKPDRLLKLAAISAPWRLGNSVCRSILKPFVIVGCEQTIDFGTALAFSLIVRRGAVAGSRRLGRKRLRAERRNRNPSRATSARRNDF